MSKGQIHQAGSIVSPTKTRTAQLRVCPRDCYSTTAETVTFRPAEEDATAAQSDVDPPSPTIMVEAEVES